MVNHSLIELQEISVNYMRQDEVEIVKIRLIFTTTFSVETDTPAAARHSSWEVRIVV